MSDFLQIFRADFLLHNALWGSIAVGVFCPLIGVYFMLRRMVLLGVALPQISAAGIAFVFFLQGLGISWLRHAGETDERLVALAGSLLFTLLTLVVLSCLEGAAKERRKAASARCLRWRTPLLFFSSLPMPPGKLKC